MEEWQADGWIFGCGSETTTGCDPRPLEAFAVIC